MTGPFEDFFPRLANAWQALTGQELYGWSADQPGPLPATVLANCDLAETVTEISLNGNVWLVACSQELPARYYLASFHPGEPYRRLLKLLMLLFDQVAGEQRATQQLTEELYSAWNRLNFLYELARIAVQAGSLPTTFSRLVRALQSVIPVEEVCLLFNEDGRTQIFSAGDGDWPEFESLSRRLFNSEPISVLHRGQNLPAKLTKAHPELHNLILLPVPIEEGLDGLLILVNHPTGLLNPADRQLLTSAAEQISTLVNSILTRSRQEATRRLEHELDIASQIQSNFLPTELPQAFGMDFAASLKPAYRVGGDFYDVQPLEDGMAIMIGDVAGKGIPAAMLTALIHATLKSETQHTNQPAALLEAINRLIYSELDRSDTFITAFLAVLRYEPFELHYASAGHTTTLLWRTATEEVVLLPSTGLPLGVAPETTFEQCQRPLHTGDVLVLYSDGITEAENEQGRVFGTQAMIDLLLAGHPASASQQVNLILHALDLHRGQRPLQDDVALFLARVKSPETEDRIILPFVYTAERHNLRALAGQVHTLEPYLARMEKNERRRFLNELELAVTEIAANIVVHAYQNSPYIGRIQGRLCLSGAGVRLDLVDSGLPFHAPAETGSLALDDPPARGYGLKIARGLLDVCSYRRMPDERNHWRLEKKLVNPHPAEFAAEFPDLSLVRSSEGSGLHSRQPEEIPNLLVPPSGEGVKTMQIESHKISTQQAVVRPQGRVDVESSPQVREYILNLVQEGASHVIVNLEAVDFMDSSGLSALVSGMKALRKDGGELVLCNTNPQIRTALRLTMLDKVFPVFDTLDEALSTTN